MAAQALYEFIWHEYCDWYLELSKPVLWDEQASAAQKRGTRRTLIGVLEATLRLAHPLIPVITEEIWQKIKSLAGTDGVTIMLAPYPEADESNIDRDAMRDIERLQAVVLPVLDIRAEMHISPATEWPLFFLSGYAD